MQRSKSFVFATVFLLLLITVSSTPAQQSPRPGTPPQEFKKGDIKLKELSDSRNKNLKPGSPEAVKNQKLAKERQRKIAEFNRRFPQEAQRFMKDLNQKLLAAQNQGFQRQVKQVRARFDQARAQAKKGDMPDAKTINELKMAPIKPQPGTPIKPGKIDASKAAPKMKVTRIFTNIPPIKNNAVKEGQLVFIVGKNFKPLPQVWLEYKGTRPEFSKNTPQYKKQLLVKEVSDTAIYAKVPLLPEKDIAYVDATLVIAGPAQQIIKKQVSLTATGPGIQSVRAAPEYGDGKTRDCAVMGGTLTVIGSDFGDKPGKIFLQLSQPMNGKKQINLLPATGNWANDWDNHVINVKIPKEPGNHAYQVANLYIWLNTNRKAFAPIPYGPKMVFTMVSGKDMAHISVKGKTDTEEAGPVLKVTHDPACSGMFPSGPNDTDRFFTKRALPKNCKINRVYFQQINPDDPSWDGFKDIIIPGSNTIIDFVIGKGVDWEDLFFPGPGKVVAGVIAKAFDPSAGQYYARIGKIKHNTVDVTWFTTCAFYATYDGVPLSYVIGFELYGPEGFVPGSY